MKKFRVSLIILAILSMASFMPILHILILYLNGALLHLIAGVFGENSGDKYPLLANGIISLIVLFIFYISTNTTKKILSAICVIIFLLPFLCYLFLDDTGKKSSQPYFLPFLLASAACGMLLFLTEWLVIKRQKSQ